MRLAEREQLVEPPANAKRMRALPVNAPAIGALRVVFVSQIDERRDAVPDLVPAGRHEELVADSAAGHGPSVFHIKHTVSNELTELIVQVVVLDEHDGDVGRLWEAGVARERDGVPLSGLCHNVVVIEKGIVEHIKPEGAEPLSKTPEHAIGDEAMHCVLPSLSEAVEGLLFASPAAGGNLLPNTAFVSWKGGSAGSTCVLLGRCALT